MCANNGATAPCYSGINNDLYMVRNDEKNIITVILKNTILQQSFLDSFVFSKSSDSTQKH